MAKKPNFGDILSDLLFYLDDPDDPSLVADAKALFDKGSIQELAKASGNLELLENPPESLVRNLQDVVRGARTGDVDKPMDAAFEAFRRVRDTGRSAAEAADSTIADLLGYSDRGDIAEALDAARKGSVPTGPRPATSLGEIPDFDFKMEGGPYDFLAGDPPETLETSGRGGTRLRGESTIAYQNRLERQGRALAPGRALTREQAIALARSTPERVPAPTRPRKPTLPDTPKGTMGRNLKARLLKMRRGIPGIPKMGLIGGSLAGLGATLTLMELLDERAEITGRSARAMKEGLMEGSDASLAALVDPSLESELTGSRALREIAQAGERNIGVSQELQDIIGADQRQLQAMKQKINPSLREAYARVGLL